MNPFSTMRGDNTVMRPFVTFPLWSPVMFRITGVYKARIPITVSQSNLCWKFIFWISLLFLIHVFVSQAICSTSLFFFTTLSWHCHNFWLFHLYFLKLQFFYFDKTQVFVFILYAAMKQQILLSISAIAVNICRNLLVIQWSNQCTLSPLIHLRLTDYGTM